MEPADYAQVGKMIGAAIACVGIASVPILVLSFFGWEFGKNSTLRRFCWIAFWIALGLIFLIAPLIVFVVVAI